MQTAATLLLSATTLLGCVGVDYATGGADGAGGAGTTSGPGGSSSADGSSGEGDSSGTGSVGATAASTTVAAATGAGGGSMGLDCATACGVLYDCGVENMNCAGFTGDATQKAAFVSGCVTTCDGQPALAGLVNGADRAGTIATLSALNAEFDAVCMNGVGGAGGSGGGGV
jgi:hypothetical protein